jgi:hypothetical protein
MSWRKFVILAAIAAVIAAAAGLWSTFDGPTLRSMCKPLRRRRRSPNEIMVKQGNCETATTSTRSVLGLCLVVPVIRFSPLVLILAPPNRTLTNRVLPLSRHICATASAALQWKVARR